MRNRVVTLVIVTATCAVAPAVAHATIWCVKDPSCPAGGNSSQTTINGAATAAINGDTILIGPGTFMESINDGKDLTYIGAGPTATVIQAPTPNTTTLATVDSLVANLGIVLGGGSSPTGLFTSGTTRNVAITAAPGTTGGTGVATHGGLFDGGSVTLPTGPGIHTVGIAAGPGHGGAVQDSTVTAAKGIVNVTNIARDRVFAAQGLSLNNVTSGSATNAEYVVDDTLVDTSSDGTEAGISFFAGSSLSGNTVTGSLTVRHSTLIGDGAGGSTGIAATATASQGLVGANVDVRSTIVRGYATALSEAATGANGNGAVANIFDDYSDFNPALESSSNSGTPVGTGGVKDGSHNVNVDPGFVDTNSADPRAFSLLATSPLIDTGAPALDAGESPLDLTGAPRFVADRDGRLAPSDIGAFEYQPHPPTVTAAAGGSAVAVGHPASFTASGSDPDPGDAVTFTWSFDDGGSASGASVTHSFAAPGAHTATVTATDIDGLTAQTTATVTVVGVGQITSLRVRPSAFVPARSGPSVVARATGAVVSYTDSAEATTTFTVQRKVTRGKFKSVGAFTHADAAGANRFTFSGRVRGHALAPGSYRLNAVASNVAGTGKPASTTFTVRGRAASRPRTRRPGSR